MILEIIFGVLVFLVATFLARTALPGMSKTGREGLFILGALVSLLVFSPLACISYVLTPVVLSLGLRAGGR